MRTLTSYVSRFVLMVHEWSALDKFRLRLLLGNSVLPLCLCAVALVLLTIEPVPTGVWKWCSGVAFVVFLSFAITMMRRFQRLDLQQRQGRPATFIFYSFFIFGIGATLLQLYNVAALGAFWPFLTGIVFQVMAAVFQFARMILVLPE